LNISFTEPRKEPFHLDFLIVVASSDRPRSEDFLIAVSDSTASTRFCTPSIVFLMLFTALESAVCCPAETLEKAAEVSEDKVDEPDFAKMLGDLKGFFSETLNKASEANAAQVTTIQETVETFSKSVDARISELAEQHTALSSAVNNIKNTIDGVQKRVDAVESETAIKKSSDLGRSEEATTIKKSKWNGSFLGSVNEIFN